MRIITGEYKGRKLLAADHLRPTGDRVREALFSILGPAAEGTFVDCFAGAGTVGLEARSRGARTIFVEKDPASIRVLRENVERLDVQGGITVVEDDVPRFLKAPVGRNLPEGPADVVFCDPPYDYHAQDKLLRVLGSSPLVGPDTIVVVERRRGTRARLPDTLRLVRAERYGETELSFYARTATPADGEPGGAEIADEG
jgi:16S rRNA (guanine966-N2)-methyltransferase